MRRTPPDILITTPESLYLMLTSQAREMLARRRGGDRRRDPRRRRDQARRAPRADARAPRGAQRRPRPAAHRPERDAEPARGGRPLHGRPAADVHGSSTPACASRSTSRSTCRSSRWSSREPGHRRRDPLDPLAGGEATRRSIWPAIYPELLELVREHRSTIVFVNNRRGAERLALRLNELGRGGHRPRPPRLARARGAPRRRGDAQGRRAAVPRRDLVARARHRHGRRRPRAAGRVAEVGRAAACSASAAPATTSATSARAASSRSSAPTCSSARSSSSSCARAGSSRPSCRATRSTCSPSRSSRSPPRAEDGARSASTTCTRSSRARTPTPSCRARCSRTSSTCSTAATRRRSSASCARASCGTASPGRSARARARASSRSPTPARSPTAACSPSSLPDGRRVGELDEEMVYEARPGQTFLLGASTWRIEEIGRDRVIVTPAPGVPGRRAVLEGRQRRAAEGARPGDRRVQPLGRRPAAGDARARLRPRPARRARTSSTSCASSRRRRASSRATARSSSSASATRSATGACACCRPYGGRVHAAWGARAVARGSATSFGLESDAIWSDDGIIVHLPDADEPPGAELVMLEPDEVEDAVVAELGVERAVRRALPRERRPRAADPARLPGQAHAAVAAAAEVAVAARGRQALRRLPDHPRDLPRVPARRARRARASSSCCAALHRRELSLVEVETPTASPFASLAAVRLRRDVHVRGRHAERRAARRRAVARPRPAARAARPGGAARADRPERARAGRGRPPAPLRPHARRRRATRCRRAAPRRRPDARRGRATACIAGVDADGAARRRSTRERRAIRAAHRRRAALDRRRRRRPVPRRARRRAAGRPARGVPRGRRPTRSTTLVARYARTHGPFTTAELRARYGVDPTSALQRARARGRRSSAASCAPAAREREWCDPEVLRRLRRASLAVLRKEIEAADQRALAAFLP